MIRSFRSKALRRFAENGDASKVSVPHLGRLERILAHLEAATRPEHMDIPGYRFHALKGADKGRFAVNASGNFRVTFAWDGRDAVEVDLEDYH
jgi:proteic killer suppression protein